MKKPVAPKYPYNLSEDGHLRVAARNAVKSAIRRGDLLRADEMECQACGRKAHEWHHAKGYSPENWLDVVPLCRSCHKKADLKIRKPLKRRQQLLPTKRPGYCPVCDRPLPPWSQSNRVYCSARCRQKAPVILANQ